MIELFFKEFKESIIDKNEIKKLFIEIKRLYIIMYYFLYISAIMVFVSYILFINKSLNVIWCIVLLLLFIVLNGVLIHSYSNKYKLLHSKENYFDFLKENIVAAIKECKISENNAQDLFVLIKNELDERNKNKTSINPTEGFNNIIIPAILGFVSFILSDGDKINIGSTNVYFMIVIVLYCLYNAVHCLVCLIKFISTNKPLSNFELKEIYDYYLFIFPIENK